MNVRSTCALRIAAAILVWLAMLAELRADTAGAGVHGVHHKARESEFVPHVFTTGPEAWEAEGQRLVVASVMTESTEPYNPLELRRLGEGIARALLDQPPTPLPPNTRFLGSGIYALYYTGDFPAYLPISAKNQGGRFEMPIYVGKGIPEGRRTGGAGFTATAGADLFRRLGQHARSVAAADNLQLAHFHCRYLVVAPVWIPLGEELLIRWFSPLWNTIVTGFGNNDPGGRRYTQQRSVWDVLHPGRAWATRCAENPRTPEDIIASVQNALAVSEDQTPT